MIGLVSDTARNCDITLGPFVVDCAYSGRAWPRCSISINGLPMHCYALRVVDIDVGGATAQGAWQLEFQKELELAQDAQGTAFQSVELEGLEGQWVIFMVPHGD